MAEFVRKSVMPKVDAIQVTWMHTQSIKPGNWIIKHPDGTTSFCDNEWFQKNYEKA